MLKRNSVNVQSFKYSTGRTANLALIKSENQLAVLLILDLFLMHIF